MKLFNTLTLSLSFIVIAGFSSLNTQVSSAGISQNLFNYSYSSLLWDNVKVIEYRLKIKETGKSKERRIVPDFLIFGKENTFNLWIDDPYLYTNSNIVAENIKTVIRITKSIQTIKYKMDNLYNKDIQNYLKYEDIETQNKVIEIYQLMKAR